LIEEKHRIFGESERERKRLSLALAIKRERRRVQKQREGIIMINNGRETIIKVAFGNWGVKV
jgi:hypothetical protein